MVPCYGVLIHERVKISKAVKKLGDKTTEWRMQLKTTSKEIESSIQGRRVGSCLIDNQDFLKL